MGKRVFTNCRATTMVAGGDAYGLVEDAAIVVDDGRIDWVGSAPMIPPQYSDYPRTDLGGALVTPALIDCHTHLVFGGDRSREFALRLEGASYEEIAKAGGGIRSTVSATREASDEELLADALRRIDDLIADGVAVIEIKSGYGLTIEHEMRMLRVARAIETHRPVHIVTSWLAAHALPPEFDGEPDRYVDEVVLPGLEMAAAEGLVDAVDGFCEGIGFTPAQIRRVFEKAQELGVRVKLHAEQLSDLKGAVLAAEYDALSADHLEWLAPEDAAVLAEKAVVAVLLPGAFYALRETRLPPLEALREHGVAMALATDCNPGSSQLSSLRLAMNMGCTLFRMTAEEALAGATRNGAKALGLEAEYGTIESGKRADLAVWDVSHPDYLSYWIGGRLLRGRITAGTYHDA
ncbi:imidazolonepropionase [Altererythrobacter arenosus]|uniref:Imidazolonepropionase n=1 Tax=Altererythrobacter arenosus TaxID=3032592 RepID=A0ABY8FN02_9SPHN|nr:imidazolonepropionase [Altererythrobacter sp. CAU 1644]WFL76409.1 imidazolonepropionase [Altererythrobacter sp. CAU 1644]